jgi:hypothetical protein
MYYKIYFYFYHREIISIAMCVKVVAESPLQEGAWWILKVMKKTNHTILLVGYMTINGGDYWICQNSWVTLGEGMKDYLW